MPRYCILTYKYDLKCIIQLNPQDLLMMSRIQLKHLVHVFWVDYSRMWYVLCRFKLDWTREINFRIDLLGGS